MVTLYMFSGSNAVLTAQLMLAHKGIEYRRVNLPPAAHAPIMLALGFRGMTVPGLKVGRRRVQGTRSIARFLDELTPERPLFPADPARRRAVEEAERSGEEFQNAVRRIFYTMGRRRPDAFREVMLAERSGRMGALLGVATPMIIRFATVKHRARDAAARADVAALPGRLDQIDAWIGEGLLNGPELNAADFQIAANVAAMLLSEDARPYVLGRPAEALAQRVAPDYTGSVGMPLRPGIIPRALPPEWMPELPTSGP